MDQDNRSVSQHRFAFFREIQGHNRNTFRFDIEPDVQLRPLRQRKIPNAFVFVNPRIENIPQFWPLILRVPLPQGVAERVNSLFSPRLLLVPSRSSKRRVKAPFRKRVQKRLRLQQSAAFLRSQRKTISSRLQSCLILMDDQLRPNLPRICVTKCDTKTKRQLCCPPGGGSPTILQ